MQTLGRILKGIWWTIRAAVFLVGLAVLGLIVVAAVSGPWDRSSRPLPASATLHIDLAGGLSEDAADDGLAHYLRGDAMTLSRLVRVLDRAATDTRIDALTMDITFADLDHTAVEALQPAIRRFREAGKRTAIFSEAYDLPRYRLATAFDTIWLDRTGEFAVTGVSMEIPFAGELVDDLGVKPQFERRRDYKTAADIFTRRNLAPNVRAAFHEFVNDVQGASDADVINGRNGVADRMQVWKMLESALLSPETALQDGLVDLLETREAFEGATTGAVVDYRDYLPEISVAVSDAALPVALISANGEIVSGRNRPFGDQAIVDGDLVDLLDKAAADDSIRAIVLRVDSPGGGYGPSDAIRRALARIEKPVVVSMGRVAASGGYLLALGADRIVAHGSTVTGSIGVLGGKVVVADLLDEYGVRFEFVDSGPQSGMFSPFRAFSPEQQARLSSRIDMIYADFVDRVATARNLSPVAAEAAAQGRIWTGRQALDLGLIDAVGGLEVAADQVLQLIDQPGRRIRWIEYPDLSPEERIRKVIGGGLGNLSVLAGLSGDSPLARLSNPTDATVTVNAARQILTEAGGVRLMGPDVRLR